MEVKPDYERGDVKLYLGDCLEIISQLDGDSISAIATDPPYGISYCHGARKGGIRLGTDCMAIIGDDKPFDPSPFLSWPCLFWGAEHFKSRLPEGGRWLVWDKRRVGVTRDQADIENAWCSCPGVARMFRLAWDGADREEERHAPRVHSNQKPVSLMAWCLEFINGETVCDPFMGSGTTGVACVRLGRKFIGIEISPKYFEIACKRIDAELDRLALFDPVAPATRRNQLEINLES